MPYCSFRLFWGGFIYERIPYQQKEHSYLKYIRKCFVSNKKDPILVSF